MWSPRNRKRIEAAHAKWQAESCLPGGNLALDQQLLRRTEVGSRALQDSLEWNTVEHVIQQGLVGKSLVMQFIDG